MDININQKHEGVGHNIVENKALNQNKETRGEFSGIPNWVKIIAIIIAPLFAVIWAIFIYFKPTP